MTVTTTCAGMTTAKGRVPPTIGQHRRGPVDPLWARAEPTKAAAVSGFRRFSGNDAGKPPQSKKKPPRGGF